MFRIQLPEEALKTLQQQGEILVLRRAEEQEDWEQGQTVLGLFQRPQNAARPVWLEVSREVATKPWFELTDQELQAGGEKNSQTFLDHLSEHPNPDDTVTLLWLQQEKSGGESGQI